MKKLVKLLLTLSLVACMAGPALAGLAVDFTGVTIDYTNGNWSLGWKFNTGNAPVTVKSMGFYDDLKNGLTQNHDVGIYDANQVMVAFATVVPSDPLVSWFRMHNITPVVLAANTTYFIQAVTGQENYTFYTGGFVVDPSINFIQDAVVGPAGGVLAFPNASNGITAAQGGADFGPNFSTDFAAPLPSTLLFLGSGLVGLIGIRRRLS